MNFKKYKGTKWYVNSANFQRFLDMDTLQPIYIQKACISFMTADFLHVLIKMQLATKGRYLIGLLD